MYISRSKIRKSISKISKKQQDKNFIYTRKRKKFMEKHLHCQARLSMCTFRATQVHHKRGRIGDNLLDQKTWLAVCASCHKFIEENPAKAKDLGLSENRLT